MRPRSLFCYCFPPERRLPLYFGDLFLSRCGVHPGLDLLHTQVACTRVERSLRVVVGFAELVLLRMLVCQTRSIIHRLGLNEDLQSGRSTF